jgi:hypothetical protein
MSHRLTLIATEKQKKFYHHEEHEAPEGLGQNRKYFHYEGHEELEGVKKQQKSFSQ